MSALTSSVNARILYWGIAAAGKTTNLEVVRGKLRSDHRGDVQQMPTRIDPTTHYEMLPMQLGDVGGLPTQIEIVTVPTGPEQAPTRKQLLDEVSGIVLVVDATPGREDENLASREELEQMLGDYGRSLADLPIVVQYNKSDQSDAFGIEALHKKLALPAAAVFEAVATEGTGVLQTLTTISKRVVRILRDKAEAELSSSQVGRAAPVYDAEALAQRAQAQEAPSPPSTQELLEDAIEQEIEAEGDGAEPDALELGTRAAFDQSFEQLSQTDKPASGLRLGSDLRIVSVGTASRAGERAVRIPLVLGDEDGATASIALTVQLDPLLDEDDAG